MAPHKAATKKPCAIKLQKPMNPIKPSSRRNASKPLRGSRAVFAGKVFVMSGEFPRQTEGWVTRHGGCIEKTITDETTHLVCTMDNFKNKVTIVKDALKFGDAHCRIVDWEFIEDSLTPKPRRLAEDRYLLKNILSGRKSCRPAVQRKKRVAENNSEGSKEFMEPPSHHIYVDKTGFEYKVILRRTISGPKNKKLEEVFTIYVFESNPLPATYVVAKKHKLGDKPAVPYHDKDVGKVFQKAYEEFRAMFELKTGIQWDQRLDKLKQDSEKYIYRPPAAGEPLGLFPSGWKEPIQDLDQGLECSTTTLGGEPGDECNRTDPDLTTN